MIVHYGHLRDINLKAWKSIATKAESVPILHLGETTIAKAAFTAQSLTTFAPRCVWRF